MRKSECRSGDGGTVWLLQLGGEQTDCSGCVVRPGSDTRLSQDLMEFVFSQEKDRKNNRQL